MSGKFTKERTGSERERILRSKGVRAKETEKYGRPWVFVQVGLGVD